MSADGMNYAPTGKPAPVVKPGEFPFAAIAPRVDEIALDTGTGSVYCASGTGTVSVVKLAGTTLASVGAVPSAPGAHSIAVDPVTHAVWIVFAKDKKPYAQAFLPR